MDAGMRKIQKYCKSGMYPQVCFNELREGRKKSDQYYCFKLANFVFHYNSRCIQCFNLASFAIGTNVNHSHIITEEHFRNNKTKLCGTLPLKNI